MALYSLLLHLYPRSVRADYGDEMRAIFRRRRAAAGGPGAIITLWIETIADILTSAAAERLRSFRSSSPEHKGSLMNGFLQDVRYSARLIARKPALSLVITLTLALGIGANVAIFSLVNTVLLRRLPYKQLDRLVSVWEHQIEQPDATRPVRPANFFEWKSRAVSFEDIAWSRDGMFALTGEGQPESITGYRFSANMLGVLGVQPALGRGFRAEEDRPGGPRVVLLSDKLWKRRYAGDRSILGRTITLNGQSYTVIGVMAPDFKHPQRAELWTPIALSQQLASNRTATILRLVGRLKPGVSREQAQAEVTALYQELAQRYPDTNKLLTATVERVGGTGDAKPLLLVLFAGVGFVLLIACANVANLLLADATSRRRELAVRGALGASRFRVIRQLLTESLLLALASGTLGAFVTWWTRDALVALFPANIANLNLPLVEQIDMGARVLVFALGLSVATGLLFGLLPAWHVARANLQGALKDGGRAGSGSRRTHAALVISEVALSIVLLAGALLMVQSFLRVQRLDFGFDVERTLTGRVILPAYRYPDLPHFEAFTRELVRHLQAVPGVDAVGITNYLPLSGWSGGVNFSIEGRPPLSRAEQPEAGYQVANKDYFRSMDIRLVAGRTFTERDKSGSPYVVVINETLAKRHWPGENPVGQRVIVEGRSGPLRYEVVGIVGDVRAFGLEEPAEGEMYFSYWQAPDPLLGIVLRTSGDPARLANQLRQAVWSVDREQPVTHVLTMKELAAESLTFRRSGMTLAGSFALLALLLAAIGIYGVLSYAVAGRTREIGVRVALGATRSEVARLVVREGMLMTGIGVATGLVAASLLTRYLGTLLYEVRPHDPLTYAAVAAMLLAVALFATWLPARRATGVDPAVALRAE